MDFHCPNCQKELTVQDQHAGLLMKCPHCANTFQAPSLPPPVAPTSPATDIYGVASEPKAPPRVEVSRPPEPSTPPSPPPPPQRQEERPPPPPPAPPPPMGDYTRNATLWLSPRGVCWVTPVGLLVLFVLSLFSWAEIIGSDATTGHTPWGWAFRQGNALTIFYLLLYLLSLPLTLGLTVLRLMPDLVRLPPALQQIWPWRSAVIGLVLFLAFFFLLLQVVTGFQGKEGESGVIVTTLWLLMAIVCHLVALIAAWLDFWLELRGPSRPIPRIDFHW